MIVLLSHQNKESSQYVYLAQTKFYGKDVLHFAFTKDRITQNKM